MKTKAVANPVAKHAHQFNRDVWFKDRKQAEKRARNPKHKNKMPLNGAFLTSVAC
jgi:hypothetical protein